MPKQKYTKQNHICIVKYFCSKVSGPSEMPQFVRELYELCALGNIVLACTKNNLVCIHRFSKKLSKSIIAY